MSGSARTDVASSVAHEHAAVFGDGPAAFDALAARVFHAARCDNDALVLMTDDPDPARLAALPDGDALLATGRLRLVETAEAYPHDDADRLSTAFDGFLTGVLAEGFSGMRVVADNTSRVRGGDGAFARWLAWEQLTDRWQRTNPVIGTCWFDRSALDPVRTAQLGALHPVEVGADEVAPFRLLAADTGVRLLGDVDSHHVTRMVRLLGLAPHDGALTLDLTEAGYVHHTVFPALELVPFTAERTRVLGAPDVLRRVFDSVGDPDGRVELA